MLRKIQIQHICIMRGKNQLLIITKPIQHNTKNSFFNIALNIRKMFVAIIESTLPCNNSCKKHCYINPICCSARKNLSIQKPSLLNNDFRASTTNNKCILQILRYSYILKRWVKRSNYRTKCFEQNSLISSRKLQGFLNLWIGKSITNIPNQFFQ